MTNCTSETSHKSLLSAINQQCKLTPHKIAFIEGDKKVSYQQLQQQINQIGSLFIAEKKSHQRIAIALDRGIDAAITLLAIVNTGNCYIPLDLKNPANRLHYIVNDSDAHLVIGKGTCPDWLGKPQRWLDLDQLPTMLASSNKQSENRGNTVINPESLAAILYTSGSTGNPKGVALSHRAMANFANWAAVTFKLSDIDCIASLAPFHFDLSIFDLFSSLSRGATVNFIPATLTFSPSRLTSWLQNNEISIWYTVPSILSFITLKGSLSNTLLPYLKTILFAGEVFPTAQLIKLCEQLPDVNFYNLYGPTETNVCCYWPVDKNRLQSDQAIPIGYSACNSALKIDPSSQELLVKSSNNLSGYWQQGQLISALTTDNFYHTGDKVSMNEQGEYCYHGRLDRMLKCSGYRVEPAEIEHSIMQCTGIENCAVIGIKDNTSGQRPAAAIVLKNGIPLANIIKPLKRKLPAYMHPSKIIVLDSLPTLNNGKTDYQALQKQFEKT